MMQVARNSPPKKRNVYDSFAPHYDEAFRPFERWFLSRMRRNALALLPSDSRILEVGAGTGANFQYYPKRTSGVASEPSGAMLKIASSKEKPERLRLVQNNAEHLPFTSGSFDAAFATLVFCSVESPRNAFAELRRVVKPGGSVILLEHVRPNGVLGLFFDALNLITAPLSGDHFNRRTAAGALGAGLRVVKIDRRALGIIQLIVCRV